MASHIFGHFRLARSLVKFAFKSMRFKRAAQAAVGSLFCATRFKYYDEKGELLPVSSPFCQSQDSFNHFLERRGVATTPSNEELLTCFLRDLALRIAQASPAQPRPIHPENAEELILGWANPPDEEIIP